MDIPDLTLSFVVTAHPRELFLHLSETLGYTVDERHPGIFEVTGALIPIQIVNSVIPANENIFRACTRIFAVMLRQA